MDQTTDGIDANPSGNNFTYDNAGRLTNAKVQGHDLTYRYDSSGGCGNLNTAGANTNRTQTIDNGTTLDTLCYDSADRLLTNADPTIGTITYDSHGNTTRLGNTVMGYDGADRHAGSKGLIAFSGVGSSGAGPSWAWCGCCAGWPSAC